MWISVPSEREEIFKGGLGAAFVAGVAPLTTLFGIELGEFPGRELRVPVIAVGPSFVVAGRTALVVAGRVCSDPKSVSQASLPTGVGEAGFCATP